MQNELTIFESEQLLSTEVRLVFQLWPICGCRLTTNYSFLTMWTRESLSAGNKSQFQQKFVLEILEAEFLFCMKSQKFKTYLSKRLFQTKFVFLIEQDVPDEGRERRSSWNKYELLQDGNCAWRARQVPGFSHFPLFRLKISKIVRVRVCELLELEFGHQNVNFVILWCYSGFERKNWLFGWCF